jgi:hypothetical protein
MKTMLKHQDARKVDEGGLAACQKRNLQVQAVDDSDACRDESLSTGLQTFVGVEEEGECHLETG